MPPYYLFTPSQLLDYVSVSPNITSSGNIGIEYFLKALFIAGSQVCGGRKNVFFWLQAIHLCLLMPTNRADESVSARPPPVFALDDPDMTPRIMVFQINPAITTLRIDFETNAVNLF